MKLFKKHKKLFWYLGLTIILVLTVLSCTNPFAPKLANLDADKQILGDQTTIEGLFINFSYSYKMQDTVVYGNLLSDDFTFVFRNYDNEPIADEAWGRDEDMISTDGLFQATQRLDLIWNEINTIFGDSLNKAITRSFTLDVIFTPEDRYQLQGKANLTLKRSDINQDWKIVRWRDESNN